MKSIEYFVLANQVIQPISASALMNDYKKGCQMFSVILRNDCDSTNSNLKNY